ncbi:MAG: UvrD-helicase domain-containing protein [Anaerolineae bacterium]
MTQDHPILEQLSPSDEQLPAVLARGQDVVVTAGAGTGKTRTLVARYISFLIEGLPLRSIVAITFTRKAAREMRNRVREEVRRYLETEAVSEDERTRWRSVYEQLDAARIGTIHSLCAEILRHHPAEGGIDPRFDMLDEGQMALLQAQAVDTALAWAADEATTVRLFADLGERELRQTVQQLLAQRLDVEEARAKSPADLWTLWEPQLLVPIREFLDDTAVQADFQELAALQANGILAKAEEAGDALAPDLKAMLFHWDAIESARQAGDWERVSEHLGPLRDHLKQKGSKSNWAPAEPKPIIKELQARYDDLVAPMVKGGIDLALDRRLAQEVLPALLRVFDRAAAYYDRSKRERRGLDFDDLEAGALHLLREHPDVRRAWREEIQALLVDEFQDTNARQRDLLKVLNGDEPRLFIVGDAKQSIYRFRGADVTVFRQEREAIQMEGRGFELATSYRAHNALVRALNALLRPVLGDEVKPEQPYVEPFAALLAHRSSPAAGFKAPYLEFHLTVGGRSDGGLDRAAQALTARIAELVAGGEIHLTRHDDETGVVDERPLNYGDIAILCRASTSFSNYENALECAGIPYLTIAGRGFYDRPEVRDLLNALRALADPADDLALAGLLRSPACGLSDLSLYHLRKAQRAEGYPSLWSLMQAGNSPLVGDEGIRLTEARSLIDDLHQRVGRVPVADILKAFLDATAYRAALLRAGDTRAVGNVAKLLSDAHAPERGGDIVGVPAFLDYVDELRDVAPREGEARTLAQGAVQIMTVHQAKGLEFPVVAMGDVAKQTPGGRGVLIDTHLGIVPPLKEEREIITAAGREVQKTSSAAYRLAQERNRDEEAAESDRLLYVAATRAQEMLLISGTVKVYKSGGIGTYGWLDRLDTAVGLSDATPPCDGEGDAIHRFDLTLDEQLAHCTIYEPNAEVPSARVEQEASSLGRDALPDLALLGPVKARQLQIDDAVQEADRDPPRRVWRVVPRTDRAWAPPWVVGQLIHLALDGWIYPDGASADFYTWAASEARSYGVTDEDQVRDAVRRAARVLLRFQASDLYKQMARAERRLHEIPYSLLNADGEVESGIIDALFHDERGWTLVEFKADRIRDRADLERQLRETDYVDQVERYLKASERLLGARPRPVLCFLNYAGHVHLVTDRWARL